MTATVEGDIATSGKTIKITEIRVQYHLKLPREKEAEALRAFEHHPSGCPAYQSIKDSIVIKLDKDFRFVD